MNSGSGSRRGSESSLDIRDDPGESLGGTPRADIPITVTHGGSFETGGLRREKGDVPTTYAHDDLSRRVGKTKPLGSGAEGKVYQEGSTALKTFKYQRAGARDREFAALQKLHKRAPGLFPEPFSKGTVTMGDERTQPAYEMESIAGKNLEHRLDTAELSRFRPYVRRLAFALKDTGVTWDNTFENVLKTKSGGYRFIDPKSGGTGQAQDPYQFTKNTLSLFAKRQESVAKALHPTIGGWEKRDPLPTLPPLPSTFKPKKERSLSVQPRASGGVILPPLEGKKLK